MNGNTVSTACARNAADVEVWLASRIAELLGMSVDEIERERPFASFGVDSLQAVGIAGDLEEWLAVECPETLLWDYPTIAALSEHLGQSVAVAPRV